MKRQATGIVLCALLLSTFGHELLNRHQLAQSARHSNNPLLSRLHSRHHKPKGDQCVIQCVPLPDNSTSSLEIIVSVNTSLVAVVNITANIALVVDLNSGLVGIFNASSGSVIIVDIKSSTGVLISGGSGNLTWSESESFNVFFQSLTSLKVLYEQGKKNGQSFTSSNISTEISVQISRALIILSSGSYSVEGKESLTLLVTISRSLSVSLKLLLVVVESTTVTVKTNLKIFVGLLEGLSVLVGQIKGGISVLVKHHVKFDLDIILESKTSVDIFLYILLQLNLSGVNLVEVLEGSLSSSESFFALLASLGGNSTSGFNGFVSVVSEIVAVVNGHSSIQALVVVLIQFYGSSSRDHDLSSEWQTAIENLIKVIDQLHLNNCLKVLVKLLHDIRDEKWIENNVNISAIIKILIEVNDSSVPLDVIIRIFVAIIRIVAIEISVSYLFLELIRLLTTPSGINIITILIPSIKINSDSSTSILVQIVRGVNIKELSGGNIVQILRRLPVIRDFYVSISRSLKTYAKLEIDVVLSRSGSRSILIQIREIFIAAIRGNISGNATSAGGGGSGEGNASSSGNGTASGSGSGSGSGSASSDGGNVSAGGGGSGEGNANSTGNGQAEGHGDGSGSGSAESGNGSTHAGGGGGGEGNANSTGNGQAEGHGDGSGSGSAESGNGSSHAGGGGGGGGSANSSGNGSASGQGSGSGYGSAEGTGQVSGSGATGASVSGGVSGGVQVGGHGAHGHGGWHWGWGHHGGPGPVIHPPEKSHGKEHEKHLKNKEKHQQHEKQHNKA